jgi:hypothetical protein
VAAAARAARNTKSLRGALAAIHVEILLGCAFFVTRTFVVVRSRAALKPAPNKTAGARVLRLLWDLWEEKSPRREDFNTGPESQHLRVFARFGNQLPDCILTTNCLIIVEP